MKLYLTIEEKNTRSTHSLTQIFFLDHDHIRCFCFYHKVQRQIEKLFGSFLFRTEMANYMEEHEAKEDGTNPEHEEESQPNMADSATTMEEGAEDIESRYTYLNLM